MTAGASSGCIGDWADDAILRRRFKVAALQEDHVLLTATRLSGCGGCAARSGCGAATLAEIIDSQQGLRLPRTLPLVVGDEVVVAMDSSAFLGTVLRAYLVPAAALVVTAAVSLAADLPDATTAALCLPALALSLVPLARAGRRAAHHPALRIEARVDRPLQQ